jgi:hypothetical protein
VRRDRGARTGSSTWRRRVRTRAAYRSGRSDGGPSSEGRELVKVGLRGGTARLSRAQALHLDASDEAALITVLEASEEVRVIVRALVRAYFSARSKAACVNVRPVNQYLKDIAMQPKKRTSCDPFELVVVELPLERGPSVLSEPPL